MPLESVLRQALHPIVTVFVVTTVLLTRGITISEFFYMNDEMRHAMNGAFFRDVFVDLPLRHPMQYVTQYYAKYPSVNFPYWPPLFHFVEGGFFLVLGLSPWVSRLVVLCYALMAVYFWYRIAERMGPRYRAFFSTIILISLPFVLFQARVTMLEIPSLATGLGAIYFWLRFVEKGHSADLWALTGFVIAAFLTSQKALFLVFFFGFDFLIERRFHLLKRLDVWMSLLVALIPVAGWYSLSFRSLLDTRSHVIGSGQTPTYMSSLLTYTYYLHVLYQQLGPVLACLAVVGCVIALWKRTFHDLLLLAWVIAGYTCFSLLADKDVRYTIQWIPPLIYLALVALETLCRQQRWAIMASAVLALYFVINAFTIERPIVTGVKNAAEFVVSQPQSDIVYYQGSLDRDFIFFVREFDPEKSHMILKGKQVTLMASSSFDPNQEFVPDESKIVNLFGSFGIRYAIIQDQDGDVTPAEHSLYLAVRKLLNSDQFELVRTFQIQSNQRRVPVRQISVFRYRQEVHRTIQKITLPVDSIDGRGLSVDLSRLVGRPWPN